MKCKYVTRRQKNLRTYLIINRFILKHFQIIRDKFTLSKHCRKKKNLSH